MNDRIVLKAFLLAAVLLPLLVNADGAVDRSADVWRSPPGAVRSTEVRRALPGIGPMMPLLEIAMISRLCERAAFQRQLGKSAAECARAVYLVKGECTKSFQRKFPRGDNAEIDGRLSYKKFAAGYMRCLKKQFAAKRAR